MGSADYNDMWENDPTAKRWVQHVLDDMAPKMSESALVMQIVPDKDEHGAGDVKFWVELGASIMMNKPIIAIGLAGQEIPAKLKLVADEVVYLPEGVGPEASDELQAAMSRILGDDEPNG